MIAASHAATRHPDLTGERHLASGRPIYWTGRVAIGLLHQRPMPQPTADQEALQRAVLDRREPMGLVQAHVLLTYRDGDDRALPGWFWGMVAEYLLTGWR